MQGKPRPKRWYHGWNIVAACVLMQTAALALTINCFSLFVPSWTRDFHVPVSDIALAISLASVVTAVLSYVVGVAADRYPARWLFGTAIAALCLSHLLIGTAGAAWHLQATYAVLVPLALACASIPCQALVSRWFVRRVGLAMGITAFGLSVAGVIFPQIVVALLPEVGWRTLWIGMIGLVLLIVLPVMLLVVRDRPDPEDPFGYMQSPHDRPLGEQSASHSVRDILSRRNFWAIMGAFACIQLISMTTTVNIAPIIVAHGGTAENAGLFLSAYYASALVCKLGSGWLSDRIGTKLLIAVATAAAASGAMLLALPDARPAFILGVAVLLGMAAAIWTLLAAAMLAEFGSASFGRAYGLACTVAPIGSLAPPIVALVQESTGSYLLPLTSLGGLAFLSVLGVLLLYRPARVKRAAAPA